VHEDREEQEHGHADHLVGALRVEQHERADREADDAHRDERDPRGEHAAGGGDGAGSGHHIASRVESHLVCSTPGRPGAIMRAG
jgi:hypothetical protein